MAPVAGLRVVLGGAAFGAVATVGALFASGASGGAASGAGASRAGASGGHHVRVANARREARLVQEHGDDGNEVLQADLTHLPFATQPGRIGFGWLHGSGSGVLDDFGGGNPP